jgi:hypothetical protein
LCDNLRGGVALAQDEEEEEEEEEEEDDELLLLDEEENDDIVDGWRGSAVPSTVPLCKSLA